MHWPQNQQAWGNSTAIKDFFIKKGPISANPDFN
jgi:hypothetical protein